MTQITSAGLSDDLGADVGRREGGATHKGSDYSAEPEPARGLGPSGEYSSRSLPAGTLQIYRGIATGTTGAFMAPADVALLIGEIDRLTLRLINGPANMQECAEFCRIAREDGDGKPCLDCHPENFTF